jgi:hypothetical protein
LAIATKADVTYCFGRARGNDPERLPPAWPGLQLRIKVSFRNEGTRSVILPLERKRTIYTALDPADMRLLREHMGVFQPVLKLMTRLPPGVSLDSPVTPKNDFFTVIPPGGERTPPLSEEITLPLRPNSLFKGSPDLRGHTVYVELRYVHRDISAALKADLSDRWSRFGVPWTGTLTTNTIEIDVPANPPATAPCIDTQTPAHKIVGLDDRK